MATTTPIICDSVSESDAEDENRANDSVDGTSDNPRDREIVANLYDAFDLRVSECLGRVNSTGEFGSVAEYGVFANPSLQIYGQNTTIGLLLIIEGAELIKKAVQRKASAAEFPARNTWDFQTQSSRRRSPTWD